MVEGYCVKCKAKREISDMKNTELKRKTKAGKVISVPAVKGKCPKCGTGMFKIVKKK